MKKHELKKFLDLDDSFYGDYIIGKFIGLPFDICTSCRHGKKDLIPRIHIVKYNDENLAKLATTRSYQILGNGKLKRITLYHQDFNENEEKILQAVVDVAYKNIVNYFFLRKVESKDYYLPIEKIKKHLILLGFVQGLS